MHRVKFFNNSTRVTINSLKSYVTASHINTPTYKARIKASKDETVVLQVLSDNMLGENLQPAITFRELAFGSAWHTLLKIENKKEIAFENEYVTVNNGTSLAENTYIPKQIIYWKKLFAVPQPIWDEFLGYLPNKEVVNLLNLQKHRHLWPAYQYAISGDTYNNVTARAKLIGEYHFLMSSLDSKIGVIKNDLDAGRFDVTKMTMLNPAFTLPFLNKLRFCTTFFELRVFANIVNSYAKTCTENINKQRLHTAIEWLPSSVNEPDSFLSSLKFANYLTNLGASSGRLFFNSKNNWQRQFSNSDLLVKTYLDALFEDLIRRQLIIQANAINAAINAEIIASLKEQFQIILTENIGINKLIKLQASWQNKMPNIAQIRQIEQPESSWEPIIAPTKIDGIKIRALSSEKELYEHGVKMENCVQSSVFINLCRSKEADIIVLDGHRECSTIDLRRVGYFDVTLLQHRGIGGIKPPSKLHLQVGKKLLTKLRDGQIQFTHARRMQYDDFKSYLSLYKYSNLDVQERTYEAYKAQKLLPKSLVFDTYQDMLYKTGLIPIIDKILSNSQAALTF